MVQGNKGRGKEPRRGVRGESACTSLSLAWKRHRVKAGVVESNRTTRLPEEGGGGCQCPLPPPPPPRQPTGHTCRDVPCKPPTEKLPRWQAAAGSGRWPIAQHRGAGSGGRGVRGGETQNDKNRWKRRTRKTTRRGGAGKPHNPQATKRKKGKCEEENHGGVLFGGGGGGGRSIQENAAAARVPPRSGVPKRVWLPRCRFFSPVGRGSRGGREWARATVGLEVRSDDGRCGRKEKRKRPEQTERKRKNAGKNPPRPLEPKRTDPQQGMPSARAERAAGKGGQNTRKKNLERKNTRNTTTQHNTKKKAAPCGVAKKRFRAWSQ